MGYNLAWELEKQQFEKRVINITADRLAKLIAENKGLSNRLEISMELTRSERVYNNSLAEALESEKATNFQMDQKLTRLSKENDDLKTQYTLKIGDIELENDHLRIQNAKKTQKNMNMSQKIDALKPELLKNKANLIKLTAENNELRIENIRSKEAIFNLSQQNDVIKASKDEDLCSICYEPVR